MPYKHCCDTVILWLHHYCWAWSQEFCSEKINTSNSLSRDLSSPGGGVHLRSSSEYQQMNMLDVLRWDNFANFVKRSGIALGAGDNAMPERFTKFAKLSQRSTSSIFICWYSEELRRCTERVCSIYFFRYKILAIRLNNNDEAAMVSEKKLVAKPSTFIGTLSCSFK